MGDDLLDLRIEFVAVDHHHVAASKAHYLDIGADADDLEHLAPRIARMRALHLDFVVKLIIDGHHGSSSIFTAAGVGDVISHIVSGVIPQGNLMVGIIVYAIGMAVFTMVMGNAYGAITVLTVGIGAPFVLSLGADPALIGSVALTCGFCGTLMTPMAANFNILPVAILEMKDSYGVIKKQIPIALIMLAAQIVYMIVMTAL